MTKNLMKVKTKITDIKKACIVAGLSMLAMIPLAVYANFGVIMRLTDGDDTPYNFSNSIGSVRIAIACLLFVCVLDVIAAVALYRVFAPVQRDIAKIAAALRIAYAGVFALAIWQLITISIARGGEAYRRYSDLNSALFGNRNYIETIQNNINAFHLIWDAGLLLFGIHLLLVGYLAFRATYIPKYLGVLIVIAGLGYFVDSFGALYVPSYHLRIAGFTFVGELALIGWLLLRGRKLRGIS